MDNTVSAKKDKAIRLDWRRIINSKAVKMIFAAMFGFLTALPIFPLEVSPFAVSAVAVIPAEYLALTYLGAFFSYMIGSFFSSAAAVSAMTAVMVFRLVFKNKGKILSEAYIAPLGVFLSLIVTGLLCGDMSTSNTVKSLEWIGVSALSAFMSLPFKKSVEYYGNVVFNMKRKDLLFVATTVSVFLLSFQSYKVFGVSIASVLIFPLALIMTIKLNNKEALFTSVYFGCILALGTQSLVNLLILPLSVLAARLLYSLGKAPSMAGYIAIRFIGNLLFFPIVDMLPNMVETVIEALVLVAIPKRLMSKSNLIKNDETETQDIQNEKLMKSADLFRFLSNTINSVSAEVATELSPTPERCVTYIRESLCASCELSRFCCGVKQDEIAAGVFRYAASVNSGNEKNCKLPRCAHPLDLKNKIESYMKTNVYTKTYDIDARELSTESYNIVSDVLDEMSKADFKVTYTENDLSKISNRIDFGYARYKNSKEPQSGDNCEFFLLDKYLYIIISDGMGSGKIASIESKMTCRLLKRFLICGLSFKSAIRLTNAALKAKGGDESCATADICRIDTETGKLTIVKVGAAASYVVSENRTRRISAGTLPIGILNEVKIEEINLKLKRNDSLILLTDGALNYGDEWLETHSLFGLDSQTLAEKCVEIGLNRCPFECEDDITAVCVRIK